MRPEAIRHSLGYLALALLVAAPRGSAMETRPLPAAAADADGAGIASEPAIAESIAC